jgi:biotin operon repressor
MSTHTALLNAMSRRQGKDRGICARDLAAELGVSMRRLRSLISAAREEGVAICGRPQTGYYMPTTPEELEAACRFLRARAMHSLRALSRMQRVTLPVLLGQMLLNQG